METWRKNIHAVRFALFLSLCRLEPPADAKTAIGSASFGAGDIGGKLCAARTASPSLGRGQAVESAWAKAPGMRAFAHTNDARRFSTNSLVSEARK